MTPVSQSAGVTHFVVNKRHEQVIVKPGRKMICCFGVVRGRGGQVTPSALFPFVSEAVFILEKFFCSV